VLLSSRTFILRRLSWRRYARPDTRRPNPRALSLTATWHDRREHSRPEVERSHLTDKLEFYQLLDYTDEIDLRDKLAT